MGHSNKVKWNLTTCLLGLILTLPSKSFRRNLYKCILKFILQINVLSASVKLVLGKWQKPNDQKCTWAQVLAVCRRASLGHNELSHVVLCRSREMTHISLCSAVIRKTISIVCLIDILHCDICRQTYSYAICPYASLWSCGKYHG